MNTDVAVIAELRRLFLEGATPSRLIQHILTRHPEGDGGRYSLIQDYFAAAFHVPFVRNLRREHISCPEKELTFAYLNESLLHEIVTRLPEWIQDVPSHPDSTPGWVDTLRATDDDELFRQAQASPPPELLAAWPSFSDQEREFICRLIANGHHLYERSRILARLAERLQQQLLSTSRSDHSNS